MSHLGRVRTLRPFGTAIIGRELPLNQTGRTMSTAPSSLALATGARAPRIRVWSVISASSFPSLSPLQGSFPFKQHIMAASLSTNNATPASASTQLLPPPTPSNLPITSLIQPSTMESLQSLPEIQTVLGILNGTALNISKNTTTPAQALTNLQRARDILQSIPNLHSATYLLEIELHSSMGQFQLALDALLRYQHLLSKQKIKGYIQHKQQLQFLHAKLLFQSGQFENCLSEYEDLMEVMQNVVERQMEEQKAMTKEGGKKNKNKDNNMQPLPVIDGASSLTGIGVSNLMLYLNDPDENGDASVKDEIYSILETATDMLLESRKDAIALPEYTRLALDLGIAASISLGNLGVAHHILYSNSNADAKKRAIQCWKQGIMTLDVLLQGAVKTATIIPKHKFQIMESVRARLHCNIAWALLGLDALEKGEELPKLEDEVLKEASDEAKKALDIYDELINGPKALREESTNEEDIGEVKEEVILDETEMTEEEKKMNRELEEILKREIESKKEQDKSGNEMAEDLTLSPLWVEYCRSESARALGLVAHCYAQAGAAVTAEGLFQSALDASSSYPYGQDLEMSKNLLAVDAVEKGVSRSSPNLGLIARDVRLWYAALCDNWDKRKSDAKRLREAVTKIEQDGVLKGFLNGDGEEEKMYAPSILSSIWMFSPLDFHK